MPINKETKPKFFQTDLAQLSSLTNNTGMR